MRVRPVRGVCRLLGNTGRCGSPVWEPRQGSFGLDLGGWFGRKLRGRGCKPPMALPAGLRQVTLGGVQTPRCALG